MKTTPFSDDALDALLSDFFKGQVKNPWPAAPDVSHAGAEPSGLVAARAAHSSGADPRNQPAATRDPAGKARYTLAASVAILLGTCWALSNGFPAGERPAGPAPRSGPGLDLGKGTADGQDTLPGKVKKANDNGFVPPKIEFP